MARLGHIKKMGSKNFTSLFSPPLQAFFYTGRGCAKPFTHSVKSLSYGAKKCSKFKKLLIVEIVMFTTTWKRINEKGEDKLKKWNTLCFKQQSVMYCTKKFAPICQRFIVYRHSTKIIHFWHNHTFINKQNWFWHKKSSQQK